MNIMFRERNMNQNIVRAKQSAKASSVLVGVVAVISALFLFFLIPPFSFLFDSCDCQKMCQHIS